MLAGMSVVGAWAQILNQVQDDSWLGQRERRRRSLSFEVLNRVQDDVYTKQPQSYIKVVTTCEDSSRKRTRRWDRSRLLPVGSGPDEVDIG